jgi:zinc protease
VSALELKIAKNKFISSNIYMQDSMMAQMLQLGSVETSGVGWQESYNFAQNVKAVTPQQIQAVAKLYFTKNNLTIAFLHPIEQQSKQEDLSGDNHEI